MISLRSISYISSAVMAASPEAFSPPPQAVSDRTSAAASENAVSLFMLTISFLFRKAFYITPPLFFTATAQGACAPGVGRKTKTLCRAMPTQREKRSFFMQHDHRNTTTKAALYKKAGMSYHIPCGAAGWPLCRWSKHLRRFPGVGPLGNCRIFVFHDDYSRKRLLLQEGKPPRPIGPGRLISSHNPAPARRC